MVLLCLCLLARLFILFAQLYEGRVVRGTRWGWGGGLGGGLDHTQKGGFIHPRMDTKGMAFQKSQFIKDLTLIIESSAIEVNQAFAKSGV